MAHPRDYVYDTEKQCTLPVFFSRFKDKLPLLIIVTEGFYGETKYDDFANDQMAHPRDYVYDTEKQCTLPVFFSRFKDKLPLLIIVTEGFYGETKYDDFANDQIIRLHRPCQQLRALGRLSSDAHSSRDEFVSIPVDGKYKFAVVKGFKKVGNAQTMEEIISENELPVQVKYASYNIALKSSLSRVEKQNILITKTYVEDYMQGNCMEDHDLSRITTLVALSPDTSVSIITGYTLQPKNVFQAKLKSMDEFVEKNVQFKDNEGNPDITLFERDSTTTGTGNAIPPNLLPPPQLVPRKKKSQDFGENDIYEKPPDPDPVWSPPLPPRESIQLKPALPPRPQEQHQIAKSDKTYLVIQADESSKSSEAEGGDYMYISEAPESGYNSSKDSWSAGSSHSYVSDKSVNDIQDILKTLNLSKYCEAFREQLIDGIVLEDLNEEILRKDFSFMHVEAVRLMKYVRAGHIPK